VSHAPEDAPLELLDPELLRILRGRRLPVSVGAASPVMAGPHRTERPGAGIEFVSFRDYVPGDPVRHLDWRLLARTERSYVRRLGHEASAGALLLLDASGSMGVGLGGPPKLRVAASFLLHLGALLDRQGDRPRLIALRAGAWQPLPGLVGEHGLHAAAARLDRLKADGRTRLADALGLIEREHPDLVVLASDLLTEPGDLDALLRVKRMRAVDLRLVQVLDPRELDLGFTHDVRLEDPEDPSFGTDVDPRAVRRAYQEALARFLARVDGAAAEANVPLFRLSTGMPLRETLLRYVMGGAHGR